MDHDAAVAVTERDQLGQHRLVHVGEFVDVEAARAGLVLAESREQFCGFRCIGQARSLLRTDPPRRPVGTGRAQRDPYGFEAPKLATE